MPDFNDVVRHIILKIVVDSGTLAEELAKSRAQLKAQEAAEKESNKRRAKDAEQVTDAYGKQTDALKENAEAHKDLTRASERSSQQQTDQVKKSTEQIRASTREQIKDLKEVEDLKDRDHKRDLERLKAESAARAQYDKTIAESAERSSREQQRLDQQLAEARRHADDAAKVREATRGTRIETTEHLVRETGRRGTAEADKAEYTADIAKTDALDRAEQRVTDSVRRRRSLINEEKRARQELNNLAQAGNLLEQRALALAEQRNRTQERYNRIRSRRGISGALQSAGALAADTIIAGARAVITAPRAAARAGREFDASGVDREATKAEQSVARLAARLGKLGDTRWGTAIINTLRGIGAEVRDSETAFSSFFSRIGRDSEGNLKNLTGFGARFKSAFAEIPAVTRRIGDGFREAAANSGRFFRNLGSDAEANIRRVQRLRAQVTGFFSDINRARSGGTGGSLFGDMFANAAAGLKTLDGVFSGFGKHLVSFQSLIFLVVAALGPLVAILGAVGAAALGVVSNMVSLAGSLAALPGLISAAASAFGVLYLVMSPLTKVFSAYTRMQDEAVRASNKGSKAAVDAANAVVDATRRVRDAQTAHTRALQDEPRAAQALATARKQARRDLEDLHEAYQKIKFDEEGAQLDVDSAKQAYKRALVDPTATKLDRAQARHNLEGAYWDQRDQAKNAQRTQEDYAEALKKGVDGMDAVVQALRALEDAHNNVSDTATDAARAQEDLTQAQLDAQAGSAAARTAQEAYQAELAKLGPKTREFIESLKGLGDQWRQFQKDLSDNLFGKLLDDAPKVNEAFEELKSFLMPVAGAFGDLAHQALALFTNPEWKKFFSEQGSKNADVIKKLGGAALDAADAFKAIVEIARPFTDFVVDGIKNASESIDNFFNSADGRDKSGKFLERTQQRLGEIWTIIKNLAGGFAGFFQALNTPSDNKKDFTTWFNEGLIKAAENFKALGEEAANPNSGFRKWLENVKPLLHEIVGFLKGAADFFGRLFSDPKNLKEAEDILRAIAEKWLPKLSDFFVNLSESGLISSLSEAIGGIVSGLDAFSKSEPFKVFTTGLEAIVSLLTSIPGLLEAIVVTVGTIFTAALAAKIAKPFVGGFQFVRNLVKSTTPDFGDDTDTGTGRKPSRTKPGVLRTAGQTIADRFTGDTKVEPTLGRMEAYLREIEINTRPLRRGWSGGGAGGGGDTLDTGGGDRRPKPKPTGDTSRTSRRRRKTTDTRIQVTGLPARIDPYETGGQPTGQTPASYRVNPDTGDLEETPKSKPGVVTPYGTAVSGSPIYDRTAPYRPDTSRTTELAQQTAQNEEANKRRRRVGLPPLPDSYVSSDRRTRTTTISDTSPIDLRQTPGSIYGHEPTKQGDLTARPQPTPTLTKQASTQAKPPSETTARTVPVITPETPVKSPIEPVPTSGGITGTPTQFRPTVPVSQSKATPTGTGSGAPTRPILADVSGKPGVLPAGTPTGTRPPRSFGVPSPGPTPKSLGQRIRQRFTEIAANDEGSIALARHPSTRQKPSTTLAPDADLEYEEGYQAGYNAALGGADSGTGVDLDADTGDDEKKKKPSRKERRQARKQARKQRRHARKQARRNRRDRTTTADLPDFDEDLPDDSDLPSADLDDDEQDTRRGTDLDLDDESDTRRGTGVDDDEPDSRKRRRGVPAEEDGGRTGKPRSRLRRGARGLGRGARGLGRGALALAKSPFKAAGAIGRLGKGLARGAAGGVIGAVAGMAAEVGGGVLIDKFVKNDEDKGSLSRGLGAVAQGAGIGAMVGSVIPGVGTAIGGAVGGAAGGIYSLFKDKNLREFVEKKLGGLGHTIVEGLKSAGTAIANFFTKTIPGWWNTAVKSISHFFIDTLPTLALNAVTFVLKLFLKLLEFWYVDLPIAIAKAFMWLVKKAVEGVDWVLGKVGEFIRFWVIDVPKVVGKFFTKDLPEFAKEGFNWVKKHLLDPLGDFFTKTIPGFFTDTIPKAISKVTGFIHDYIVAPIQTYFSKLASEFPGILLKPGRWVELWKETINETARNIVSKGHMSGGLIEGVYQGVEDHVRVLATPGEFMLRKRVVDEPGAKAILHDWNEGRIKVSDLVGGLAAATAPPVMSIVPPETMNLTGKVPSVVNHTVHQAPVIGGDVTINNPVREKSEFSIRRQLQISANRHRR